MILFSKQFLGPEWMPASAIIALTPGIGKVLALWVMESKSQRLFLQGELKGGEKVKEQLRQG